tara:strand:- start:845 stop:1048 length:204 start_codon:yes stop_codon:yes gene_type:complete
MLSDIFYHIPDIKNEWDRFKVFNSNEDIIEWIDLNEWGRTDISGFEFRWNYGRGYISESEVKMRIIK